MKIACIIHSLDGGGAERVMAALATRLSLRDHDVTLITLDDGVSDRHDLGKAVTRRPLDLIASARSGLLNKLVNRRRRLAAIKHALLDESPAVVLSFCDRTNIDVLAALKGTRVPVVVSERSDPSQQNLGWVWEFLRRRHYSTARVIALTDTSAKHLQPLTNQTVTVIPSAIDVPPIVSDRLESAKSRRLIAIGRLEHEKGFDRLLNAFSEVSQKHPDWSLRILGEGSLRDSLQEQAAELGIDHKVQMPGWIRPVWDELAAASVFVLPSRYEGFPSALLEAMAVGVPSVAVDCESGPRAIIRHEVDGLLVGNTQKDLTDGIHRLIEQSDLREQFGAAGRAVVERFGWDAMVDRYEDVLTAASKVR